MGGGKRLPLSFAQRGNWAAQRLFPGSAAFCVCDLVWLDGAVDVGVFADAVSGAFAETEALRVVIDDDDGAPSQSVDGGLSLRTVVPEEVLTDEEIRVVVRAGVSARESSPGEDLTSSTLFRRAGGGWVWSFTTNNLLLDGYSTSLFIRRVAELYSAAVDGTPAPPRWFGRLEDLVAGSASTPGGSDIVGYWRGVLAVDVFSEPVGSTPADLFSFSYRPVPVALPVGADDRLRVLARQAKTSWTDLVITAWGLFTALVGSQDYLAVRVPSMMRGEPESLRVPGAVARALPVVTALRPGATVGEVLSVVGSQVRDLRDNSAIEDHQLARLWQAGELSYLSLPSVNIKMFRTTPVFGKVPGVTELVNPGPTGVLDLSVYGSPGRGLRMNISGGSPLVPAETAGRHAAAFTVFLGHLLDGSAGRTLHELAELTTVPSSTDAVSTDAVSVGAGVVVPAVTVDGLIRDQVGRSPGAVAVVEDADGGVWTYARFDARVNSLARLLVERGVTVGDRVAVVLPRSVDLVTAVVAVLRAGAAYVPVDPGYPAERVTAILQDSGARVVITDSATAAAQAGVFTATGVTTVVVDEPAVRGRLEQGASDGPVLPRPLTPDDTAYVIFTSGTTGRPKGVALSHAAVVNRLVWGREVLGFSSSDRVLLKTPFTFDVSVPEFFLPLIVGAVVVVARDGAHGDPDYIADVVRERQVTSVHFVPSMLQAFLDSGVEAGSFPGVRLVSFTGEALPVAAAVGAREVFDRAGLFNLYGPTEAAVEIASYDIAALHADAGSTPIGRPVSNSYVRVLDGWLRPVPAGVTGELYLGGVQLAEGYASRAGLTAERFVADPFGGSGGRLYRTGDLARWNGQGELEYLGRSDDQVKVRGFRIELDEIRAVLERHPAVSGAAVTALDHPAGGKFLAAYVTTSPSALADEAVLAEVLREHTAALLPEYMVPVSFTRLAALPTTSSGKLDRTALAAPDLTAGSGGGRPPETDTELALAGVFRDVLALPEGISLSVDDDFFRLGGHSLLATRVVARANAILGSGLTLRDVFDHPTIAGLAGIVIEGSSVSTVPALQIGEIPRPANLPASFGQQALWVIDRLGGPGGRYVVPMALRLSGELDVSVLDAAVKDVVTRHEALRTLIVEDNGRLRQVVVPAQDASVRLTLIPEDLSGVGGDAVEERIADFVRQGFDLAADIPFRAGLLREAGTEWVLVLAMHHHAVDEWSLPVLLGDLSTAYQARSAGCEPGWAPLKMQYADYAIWQRDILGDPADPDSELAQHLSYWRNALADAPEESTITLDRSRPAEPTHQGGDTAFAVASETVTGLRGAAQHNGVSMFMIMQAAIALTVSALGGGDDVVIGSPVGGRTEDGLENLVGYFVNTLPVRHRLRPDDTISDLLGRVRQTVLDGLAHQAAPFEHIVSAVGVDRSVARNPVFQVMLTHQNLSGGPDLLDLPGVTARQQHASLGAVKTDLDIYVDETQHALTGSLSYATDLFDPGTAERFLALLQRTLTTIATRPDARIADLPVLFDADAVSVGGWSVGAGVVVPAVTVDGLIRDQVGRSPGAVAVVDDTDGGVWTYARFDARVNALARLLVERGVTVGDRVAVVLPRSADLVTAVVAVLRAGAAYVPVDPGYPAERVTAILQDSGARVVITDSATAAAQAGVFTATGVTTVVVDEPAVRGRLEQGASDAPVLPRPLTPDDTAYVIFTSGTTGRPKGVALSHAAVVNRLVWGREVLGFSSSDRVLLKTPFTFDVSVPEFFLPLIVGAVVVVARDNAHGDPGYIAGVVRERQVTSVHFVPSMLQAFLDSGVEAGSFPGVRLVSFTGEALPVAAAVGAREVFDRAGLFNLYGPTEAAVEIASYDIAALHADAGSTPIGRPVSNSYVRVLDGWLRPVPAGVTGELYLGGVQLAEGYASRAGLTAERFVADPFGGSGGRLYRTGDLARWNGQGELEYLGRSDDQVKVRGFRIELDEIRAVLERHPAVSGAAVTALDHPAGGKFLAAYVTTSPSALADEAVLAEVLREHTAALLPEYMVPVSFTRLAALPTTSSGKLDRTALPAPDLTAGSGGGRPPETDTELALAGVFRDVLALPEGISLSVDDDFFRLGGHSLLATRVVARANAILGSGLTLRDVFDHPTIAGLAGIVIEGSSVSTVPALQIGDIPRPANLPASFGQQALWITDQIAGKTVYRMVMTLQSREPVDVSALQAAVRRLVARHEILRTTFVLDEDTAELRQRIHPAAEPDAALVTVEQIPSSASNARIAELVAAPIDLASDYGLRFCLLRREEDDLLVAAGHHIVTDDQSFDPFLRDLNALYREEASGTSSELVALPVQFADFALWHRAVLGDPRDADSRYRRELEYWHGVLEDLPTETPLPIDHPRTETDSRTVRPATAVLSDDEVGAVDALLIERRATPLHGLMTALALALWSEGTGTTVPIGMPASLRDLSELGDLIGYFVNTVVIRSDIDETEGFGQALTSMRERMLEANERKLVPFDAVVEAIQPVRTPGISPLFQVMAAYLDQSDTEPDPAATFVPYVPVATGGPGPTRPALFDLVYSIARRGDGALALHLNAARELFSEDTSSRLLQKTRLFLTLGARHPELASVHLAEMVQAALDSGLQGAASGQERPVFRLALPAFDIQNSALWRAAVDHVALALGGGEMRVQVLDDGSGELVAAHDDVEALDAVGALLAELVAGYGSQSRLVIETPRAGSDQRTDAELSTVLEDPFWDDWIDQLAAVRDASLPSKAGEAPAFATHTAEISGQRELSGTTQLEAWDALARTLARTLGESQLVVERCEPADAFTVRSYPVLLGEPATTSNGGGTHSPLILSPERAAEYASLRARPQLSRFFDDLPLPRIRISVFRSAAERIATVPAISAGNPIQLDICILIDPGSASEPRTVRVEVETAPGIDLDARALAEEIATATAQIDFALTLSRRSPSGLRLRRADRLTISREEEERIRARYGKASEILPLSTLQRGIFYHMVRAQESDDHNAYVSQATRELSGAVDPDRLEGAVRVVLDRYPNLRAAFVPSGEAQVIPAVADAPFRIIPLTEWSELRVDIGDFLAAERREPFDFQTPPLIRFTLIERSTDSWILAMCFEHILLDGWSLKALFEEILTIYADPGYAARVEPASFRSYLEWLDGRDPETGVRAWSDYLAELTGPTMLWPEGGDLSAGQIDTGDLHYDLDPSAAAAVYRAARTAQVTVGTVLQASWAVALSRLTGSDDVVFGNTVSGRPPELPDADRTIGVLFNTVPMRVRLSPFETAQEMLARVQSEQLLVIDHPDTALTNIQASAGMAALFDTLFVVQNLPFQVRDERDWAGVRVVGSAVDDATHYPVTFAVNVWERAGSASVHVRLSYRRDAYDAASAEEILERYVATLNAIASRSRAHVGELTALLPDEVEPHTGTIADLYRDVEAVTVAGLFGDQVLRSPGEIALVAGARSFTFAGLSAEVNRYARLLLERGVRQEHRVALLLPRDERMVIAMFAVFAVGAAYVPVDAELPDDRIGYMLDVAGPTVTLVTDRDVARLGSAAGRVVNLDDAVVCARIAELADGPVTVAERGGEVSLDHLAYIIFTSGSTGRPKGVAVGYRGLTNMYANHVEKIFDRVVAHQGGRRMRIAHTTSFSFDASWEQLFWLLNGHSVYVINEEMRRDPQQLLAYYDDQRIDGFDVTPSYGQVLVDEGLLERDRPAGRSVSADATGVVFVSLGGEAVPERLWQQLRDAPGVESYNLYGPTEYTINALGADLADSPNPSVGTPIFNTRAYILDQNLQFALPGVPGELYLAGVGSARGYWEQSALAAERFVACPWEAGARMYRTGDLARWNDEGRIDFLGRVDEQTKIRGYRIEPGEIRDVLEAHPEVARAEVIAADHPSGGKFLAAYVTTARIDTSDDALRRSLREYAAQHLPDYMIPTTITRIDSFATTVNGKLDRKALPVPDLSEITGTDGRALQTPTERSLAEVFRAVLGLGGEVNLRANDDFFRLGGHSLLATRVVARANAALGSALTLRDMFEQATIEGLARVVDRASQTVSLVPRVGDLPRPELLPVTYGQRSLWVIEQMGGPGARYVVPLIRHLSGELDETALRSAVQDVVARHEALRTLIVGDDGQLHQMILTTEEAALRLPLIPEDFIGAGQDAIDKRLRELVRSRFDLAADIPVRAGLLRVEVAEWILVLAVHHHAVDEWSTPTVLEDLFAAYAARSKGHAPTWESVGIQYADYAVWQQAVLGQPTDPESALHHHLKYWADTLADAPGESTISPHRPRPAEPTYRAADVSLSISSDVVADLRRVEDGHGVTMFMISQAAVALAISVMSASDDVVLGAPVGGRTEDGLEGVVGYFVNTIPLRHRYFPGDTFSDVLARVKQTVLDGFDHQAAPFDQIVTAISADRVVGRNPVFQVMLTYQRVTGRRADPEVGDLVVRPRMVGLGAVKGDLDLYLADSDAGVSVLLTFSTDLFEEKTAVRFLGVIQKILGAIAEDPNRTIAEVDLLIAEERPALEAWTTGSPAELAGVTVAGLFGDQVLRSPGEIALVAGARSFTFAGLSAEVNRYARLLLERGVRQEHRVALLLPRDERMVIAMFAVFAVGAAYVPVDAELPDDRIGYMLDVAGPTVTLVTDRDVARLGSAAGRVVNLDDAVVCARIAELADGPVTVAERGGEVSLDHLAYIIFTSGSTGRPKGVAVGYRGLTNMYANHVEKIFDRVVAHQGGRRMRIAHTTSFSFDASWEQLFWLLNGHSVYVINEEMRRDPQQLLAYYDDQRIDGFDVTPSYGQVLVDEGLLERDRPAGRSVSADATGVVFVSLGGEAVPERLWQQLRDAPGVESYNLYGPTEYTINALGADLADSPNPSVGTPIFNTRAYILDQNLQFALPGVPGELYLAGVGSARGYWEQSALAAERFVACPWEAGARMYRTGDLARWNDEGRIDFLGRVDEQTKIRGYRIEPGEIRDVLEAHPEVARAEVIAADHPSGGKFLAAYVTTARIDTSDDALRRSLREYAAQHLPDYMIPASYNRLETFPLTTTGKLDRNALPAPDLGQSTAHGRAPETDAERDILAAVRDLLGLGDGAGLSVEDDFFQLGGDSILSIQLVSRMRRMGVVISAADVFSTRTVAGLARLSDARQSELAAERTVPLKDLRSSRLWPIANKEVDLPGFSTLVQAVTFVVPPGMTHDTLLRVLNRVVAHHAALGGRLVVDADGSFRFEVPARSPEVAKDRMVIEALGPAWPDPTWRSGNRARVEELARSLHLDAGVLWRAVWYTGSADATSRLLLVMHHLVVDGVSWRVLGDDLRQAWELETGRTAEPLLPVGTSLLNWAEMLAGRAAEPDVRAQTDYWAETVTTDDPLLGSRALDAALDTRATAKVLVIQVPARVAGPVLKEVPGALAAEINDVLLGSLTIAVGAWRARRGVGHRRVLIGLEGHGREETFVPGSDLSRTVGWFTTWFPVGLDTVDIDPVTALTDPGASADVVRHVNEQLRAVPDRGIGYGVLRELAPDSAGRLVDGLVPQIGFNYLGQFGPGGAVRDSAWEMAPESPGIVGSADRTMPLFAVLDISLVAVQNAENNEWTLRGNIVYAAGILSEAEVSELLELWVQSLETLTSCTTEAGVRNSGFGNPEEDHEDQR
ncbi:amino acid adenylation domain-containing protein [Frankia sp. CH37]|nr:amino acid adenylation domain-containing protein [Parafrankia sp. CH37]